MDLNIFPLFSQEIGFALLAFYAIIVFGLTYVFSQGYNKTKTGFLLANRQVGYVQGSMSIAAAWTWAPAMFISSQQAYTNGLAGLFWFCIGNAFSLILFGYFVQRIREAHPDGFTLGGCLRQKYSERVKSLLVIEMIVLACSAFVVNVLAGSQSLELLTGINYHITTFIIALIALSYALRGGLKASIVTEMFKVCVFYAVWVGLALWAIDAGGGWSVVQAGLGGKTGNGAEIFGTPFALGVMFGFGLPTALGHLSSPWADNSFYQRAFAIEKKSIWPSYITGNLIFIIVPILSGSLGLLAAGLQYDIPAKLANYANVISIATTLPEWTSILFVFVALASLISILDSQYASGASIGGSDLCEKFSKNPEKDAVKWGRWGMVGIGAIGLAVANIPGLTLITVFLVYGVTRACVWFPIMLSLLFKNLITEKGIFWGILSAWFIGMPIYLYGQLYGGGMYYTFAGTMTAVFGSGLLSVLISKLTKD